MFNSADIKRGTFNKVQDVKDVILKKKSDFLMLNYRMPEMNGDQLAMELTHLKAVTPPMALMTDDIEVKTKYKFEKVFKKPYDIHTTQSSFDSLKK